MDLTLKIVGNLPLQELWNDQDIVPVKRGRSISERDIADLLRYGPVQFVIGDVGLKLRWVDPVKCYQFWKKEVKPRLAEPNSHFRLEDFQDQYCFLASEWGVLGTIPIVVLERFH